MKMQEISMRFRGRFMGRKYYLLSIKQQKSTGSPHHDGKANTCVLEMNSDKTKIYPAVTHGFIMSHHASNEDDVPSTSLSFKALVGGREGFGYPR